MKDCAHNREREREAPGAGGGMVVKGGWYFIAKTMRGFSIMSSIF